MTTNTQAVLDQSHDNAQFAVDTAPTDLAVHHSGLIDGLIEQKNFPPIVRQSDLVTDNEASLGESTGSGSIATKLDSSGSIVGSITAPSSSPDSTRVHESSPETKRPGAGAVPDVESAPTLSHHCDDNISRGCA